MTDPIADMLTRIRNVLPLGKKEVVVPLSKLKLRLAEILQAEGYISSFHVNEKKRELKLVLKYLPSGKPAITNLRRISKPGRRVYVKHDELPRVLNGLGIAIISTSSGIMTDAEARQKKLGGEVICYIY